MAYIKSKINFLVELRAAILSELGFTSSAGIAHNKLLAKLGSSMHKPNKQTILPSASVGWRLS